MSAYPPIHDYALIGDCRTAALVSRRGSVDWLCLPRFDSPSCFNRLLDWEHGGYCAVAPTAPFTTRRFYRGESAVLVTEFRTADGIVRLTDLMPVLSEQDRRKRMMPLRQLIRRIEGLEGTVELSLRVKPRPEDGRLTPAFHARGASGHCADFGGRVVMVFSDAPLIAQGGELAGAVRISNGARYTLWIAYSEEAPAAYPHLAATDDAIRETLDYWTTWAAQCRYVGPRRPAVIRSAITLKLLSYAPSGAIVAAPTTSLPERLGGELNWDYRYCWLRDASFTAHAFFRLGFLAEATAFVRWLTHATTLTYPRLQVMYDVHGEAFLPEATVAHLGGYAGSRPVRTGNAASAQFQLDIYGELLDGLAVALEAGVRLDRDTQRWVVGMADLVGACWTQPDHGIWEIRERRRHYVHSKVWSWVALERAERLVRRHGMPTSTAAWEQTRRAIRRTVLTTGYSHTRRSFVQVLGGTHLDASVLTFPLCGFIPAQDPRMLSTLTAVQRVLGKGPLLYRYVANKNGGSQEGAFLPCSFWLAEALAAAGRRDEAERLLTELEGIGNDVGLYAEEVRPYDGAGMGNFPLALTHVAHLKAVLRLGT